jgi:hypothetical protein
VDDTTIEPSVTGLKVPFLKPVRMAPDNALISGKTQAKKRMGSLLGPVVAKDFHPSDPELSSPYGRRHSPIPGCAYQRQFLHSSTCLLTDFRGPHFSFWRKSVVDLNRAFLLGVQAWHGQDRSPSGFAAPQARWLCGSLLTYRTRYASVLAPRQRAF